jgi:hypothetical protein
MTTGNIVGGNPKVFGQLLQLIQRRIERRH